MIRRGPGIAAPNNVISAGNICLYISEHRITKDDTEIALLPKEYALIEFFLRHPNQVFSAEALMQRVWPSSTDSSPETIRSYITRLRSKLGSSKDDPIIATVHGVGYKLVI
jgi:DNA-binding response OmpR family regulator